MTRIKGTVEWYDQVVRYGFLLGSDGKQYFVHVSEIQDVDELSKQDKVIFTPGKNAKGLIAKQVVKVDGE